jgi:hypothetical protein
LNVKKERKEKKKEKKGKLLQSGFENGISR